MIKNILILTLYLFFLCNILIMTSTYVISDALGSDFKLFCSSLGLSPSKVLRRLIAFCVLNPEKVSFINSSDFISSVCSKYTYKDL